MSALRTPSLVLASALLAGSAEATTVKTGKPAASQAPAHAWATRDQLRELQSQLDHDSDTSVGAFNALVKDHNQHVRLLNQDAADSRPVNDAYNDDMGAFNRKCSQLVYRVDDMEAVVKERKKAAAAASAP